MRRERWRDGAVSDRSSRANCAKDFAADPTLNEAPALPRAQKSGRLPNSYNVATLGASDGNRTFGSLVDSQPEIFFRVEGYRKLGIVEILTRPGFEDSCMARQQIGSENPELFTRDCWRSHE